MTTTGSWTDPRHSSWLDKWLDSGEDLAPAEDSGCSGYSGFGLRLDSGITFTSGLGLGSGVDEHQNNTF